MKNSLYEETPMRGEFPRYRRLRPRRSGRIVTFVILGLERRGFRPLYNAIPRAVAERWASKLSVTALKIA